MYVAVEESVCIGCGSCAELAPAIFRMTNRGTAEAYAAVGAELYGAVKDSMRTCPVKCIFWEEE